MHRKIKVSSLLILVLVFVSIVSITASEIQQRFKAAQQNSNNRQSRRPSGTGNASPKRPQQANSPKSKPTAFRLSLNFKGNAVLACRQLLSSCGVNLNLLFGEKARIYDKFMVNAVRTFQKSKKEAVDGLFGPETLEHALKCQPLKTDVTTRQMQVVALQQLLGKRKELTVPVTGILNAATLNAVQKYRSHYMKKLGDQTIDERLWRSLFTFDESKPMPPAPKPSAPSGIPPNKPKLPTPNPVVTLPPTAIRPVVPSDPCACTNRISDVTNFQYGGALGTLSVAEVAQNPQVRIAHIACGSWTMLCHAANSRGIKLEIARGYQNMAEYEMSRAKICKNDNDCAEEKAGWSLYHSGQAFEFKLSGGSPCSTREAEFLMTEAHRFGFERLNTRNPAEWVWYQIRKPAVFGPRSGCDASIFPSNENNNNRGTDNEDSRPNRVQGVSAINMTEVTSVEQFKKTVESSGNRLIVVDFFATWCPPCRAIAPFIHELQGRYSDVTFLKVDVDKLPEVAQEHRVRAMPTFQFLKNGHTVYRFEGAMQEALVYWIDSLKDRSNITPGDLAVLEEKAPQVSVVALLKRSAGMLLLPLAIILMVFLWSALTIFLRKVDTEKKFSWLPSGMSVLALYIVIKAMKHRREQNGGGLFTMTPDKTILHLGESTKED